jgi:branched-subunit amino acid transport protein
VGVSNISNLSSPPPAPPTGRGVFVQAQLIKWKTNWIWLPKFEVHISTQSFGNLMESSDYLLLLLGMGLVTYIPRWIPLFFLTRRSLPPLMVEWLDLIPAAILSALLLPELVTTGDPLHFTLSLPQLWVAVPTLIFALWSRSLGGTVILGMFLFWMAENFML